MDEKERWTLLSALWTLSGKAAREFLATMAKHPSAQPVVIRYKSRLPTVPGIETLQPKPQTWRGKLLSIRRKPAKD